MQPSISECGSAIIMRDVLAGARLALVGVDHEVLGLGAGAGGALRDEAPLHAGGEARAAAAAQPGVLDELDELVGIGRQRGAEGLVAAGALVGVDRPRARLCPAPGEHRGDGVGHFFSGRAGGVSGMAGAAQPRSAATRTPRSVSGASDNPSTPAVEIGEDARQLQLDGAEVGERRAARGVRLLAAAQGVDQRLAPYPTVWLSKNS